MMIKDLDPWPWLQASRQGRDLPCLQWEDPEPYLEQCRLFIISPGNPFTTETVKKARNQMEIIMKRKKPAGSASATALQSAGNGRPPPPPFGLDVITLHVVEVIIGLNIGLALSKELQELDADSWVAAELSSFQLEGTTSLAPDVACIVNITPDHFERHGDMAGYVAAKSKIFAFQTPDQILILNADDPVSSKLG